MRGGAAAARVAHNHEVAGSSPAPATISSLNLVNLTESFSFQIILGSNLVPDLLVILLMLAIS